jgi:hypothetical protein
MRFKTFIGIIVGVFILVVGAIVVGAGALLLMPMKSPRSSSMPVQAQPVTSQAQPVTATQPAPAAPDPIMRPPAPLAQKKLSTAEIRGKIEKWLTDNPDRKGQEKQVDILPGEPFRATAIRFKEQDAAKWSNDPKQWSQIKLDLNRDGIDDEKWLLKNGHTYKRETLDPAGNVTSTEYFK